MPTEREIKGELGHLVDDTPELIRLCSDTKDMGQFVAKYQSWYSRATKIVELLGKDRLEEFRSYYMIDPKRKSFDGSTYVIQDYVKGVLANLDYDNRPQWDVHNLLRIRISTQAQILLSLKSRIGTILSDVRGHLLAEMEDEELAVAQRLLKVNVRATGAVAGVVLEGHLQQVAANHAIKIAKKNPSIADLNDPLEQASIYDLPTVLLAGPREAA